jgi:hypothetical protein
MSTKKYIILIYGEDQNDRIALRNLLGAILNNSSNFDIKPIQSPIILSRNAERRKHEKMSEKIRAVEKSFESKYSKVIVVAHRDCDAVEPAHIETAKALEDELKAIGVKRPIAATPAWEMETWLMLFPDALKKTRTCWRAWDPGNSNVGLLDNTKERLKRALRPVGSESTCPDYKESDAQLVMQKLKEDPLILQNRKAKSSSFDIFFEKIKAI